MNIYVTFHGAGKVTKVCSLLVPRNVCFLTEIKICIINGSQFHGVFEIGTPHRGKRKCAEGGVPGTCRTFLGSRDLLAAVQESPYHLTTREQFREFPANTEYFILESNISKVEDVGWRSTWAPFSPRSCWMPLTWRPSAGTPCRKNRAIYQQGLLT